MCIRPGHGLLAQARTAAAPSALASAFPLGNLGTTALPPVPRRYQVNIYIVTAHGYVSRPPYCPPVAWSQGTCPPAAWVRTHPSCSSHSAQRWRVSAGCGASPHTCTARRVKGHQSSTQLHLRRYGRAGDQAMSTHCTDYANLVPDPFIFFKDICFTIHLHLGNPFRVWSLALFPSPETPPLVLFLKSSNIICFPDQVTM